MSHSVQLLSLSFVVCNSELLLLHLLLCLQTEEILREVRLAFEESLPGLDWMDSATKTRAIDKARAVYPMIGYPDYITDAKKLDEHYSKVCMTSPVL